MIIRSKTNFPTWEKWFSTGQKNLQKSYKKLLTYGG
nr:MAG TPA: hypothetical protein [Caudoviricetes sp.]